MEACVQMQIHAWGFAPLDVVPRRMFIVCQKIGGQVLGAFHDSRLVGFLMGFPAHHGQKLFMHSHMLAVESGFRNLGIGRRLKLAQRDDALARGINIVEWTFDPLETKNAFFNLHRLGAIARRYLPNHYGFTSSALQAGLPTDRLVAEWHLDSPRVAALAASESSAPAPSTAIERVAVPAEIHDWKNSPTSRDKAIAAQTEIRNALTSAFAAGLAITDFARSGNGGAYLLSRIDAHED
jgi:predicted GNAT superfamily acetyltransferase